MIDSLINKGVVIMGSPRSSNPAVVVIGTARGGTSLIAGVLNKLGVFMGDRASPPVYEDVRLSEAIEAKDVVLARRIIAEYRGSHAKWGWKRPSAIECLNKVDSLFGAPNYIFIYKDIFSIAQRNAISMSNEIIPGMERALREYEKTLFFLKSVNPHALLVSYDKALLFPDELVDNIIGFCRLSPSEEQRQGGVAFIEPNPESYLDASRITKAQGRLDGVSGRTVYGWARYVYSRAPAHVDIFLNGERIATVVATHARPDLDNRLGQACAFFYDFPEGVELHRGDAIRARVTNEIRDLENSPLVSDVT